MKHTYTKTYTRLSGLKTQAQYGTGTASALEIRDTGSERQHYSNAGSDDDKHTVNREGGHVGLLDPGHVLRHTDVVAPVRLLHVLDHQVA